MRRADGQVMAVPAQLASCFLTFAPRSLPVLPSVHSRDVSISLSFLFLFASFSRPFGLASVPQKDDALSSKSQIEHILRIMRICILKWHDAIGHEVTVAFAPPSLLQRLLRPLLPSAQ